MEIIKYCDPGHGWYRVPLALIPKSMLKDLGYSYFKGDWAYLEEDCDFYVWAKQFKDTVQPFKFTVKHTNRNSIIRGYNRIDPASITLNPPTQEGIYVD